MNRRSKFCICHFTRINLICSLMWTWKEEDNVLSNILSWQKYFYKVKKLLLGNMTMYMNANVKRMFISPFSCPAFQAVLAVSAAGHGCARGTCFWRVRPAGESRASLFIVAVNFNSSLSACPRTKNERFNNFEDIFGGAKLIFPCSLKFV